MIEQELAALIREALDRAAVELGLGDDRPAVEVIRPRQKEHGDYATGVALALASATGRKPREVAELLISLLPESEVVAKAEVAGPGFINVFLTHTWLYGVLGQVLEQGPDYGRVDAGQGERVLVEFVSANPTGPLHVGTGRNAALGDALARLLDVAGYRVTREYYVNDAGNQIALFGASIEARYLERFGWEAEVPEGGYQGGYVLDLAEGIAADLGEALLEAPGEERRRQLAQEGLRRTLDGIRST
ncbi:MAG TPA: arginine--tRNA ligase, partial [Actinomycetota bacterium]